jgi:nicotinamidase-related amidase
VDPSVEPHFKSAALITIDTQVDTLDGQPLEIPGTSSILPHLAQLCRAFRHPGRSIVHVIRLYLADGTNAEPVRRSLVTSSAVLRPGTSGRLLAPGLAPTQRLEIEDDLLLRGGIQVLGPSEVVIYKPRWGAFYNTPLHAYLQSKQVDTLVFAGCNFPNCPRTSIYEASERDYRIVVADDAISGFYDRGRDEMANIGVVLQTSRQVVGCLEERATPPARHDPQPVT